LRRNCLLKQTVEGKIGGVEMTGGQGRGCKQLLDDLMKITDTENGKRKYQLTLCSELALEEATDVS
jgi:hypothetical protein